MTPTIYPTISIMRGPDGLVDVLVNGSYWNDGPYFATWREAWDYVAEHLDEMAVDACARNARQQQSLKERAAELCAQGCTKPSKRQQRTFDFIRSTAERRFGPLGDETAWEAFRSQGT